MRLVLLVSVAWTFACAANADDLNPTQRLIVACHRLDVNDVVKALREGADINGRFGDGDVKTFKDGWTLGCPVAAHEWTPLIALASSSPYPDPPRKVENTIADLNWARDAQKKIPGSKLEGRKRDTLTILLILLSHKPDLDAGDGYGATALYVAIEGEKTEMAKNLIFYGANVNTRTRIYIDGPDNITPLHQAFRSPELTKLLLENGADPNAKTSDGDTAGDWTEKWTK